MRKQSLLVLGASGYLGYHLFHHFKKKSYEVFGTYHHHTQKGLLHFDLNSMSFDKIDPDLFKKIKYAIIASGIHAKKIDDSKKHWEEAYQTNVINIIKFIDVCFEHSIMPVYLSSDFVFDGKKGNYQETDKRHPITFYGRIKYEVENHILKSKIPFLLLRMGKVFGCEHNNHTLVTDTVKTLKKQGKVYYAQDQWITPLHIRDLCQNIEYLLTEKLTGVFHLTSLPAMTRHQIAQHIQNYFKLNRAQIIPCKTKDIHSLDKRPLRVDLNDSKFRKLSSFPKRDLYYYLSLNPSCVYR